METEELQMPVGMREYHRCSGEYMRMICRAMCVPAWLIEVDEWFYGVSRETPQELRIGP